MSRKDRKITIFILAILILVLLGLLLFWQKGTNDSNKEVVSEESEEMSQSESTTEADIEQESDTPPKITPSNCI